MPARRHRCVGALAVLALFVLDAAPVAAGVALEVGVALDVAPSAGLRPQTVTASFAPPVDAPVRDPFRPPTEPYGPGNRGIEYDTVTGQTVRAAGDGVVAFAGAIGAARYVSIDHGAGLRTTYSYLGTIAVARGVAVRRGQPVGTASEVPFHFGARRGGIYLDPADLFALVLAVRGVLVPIDAPWT